ncbi:MAG: cupin domain-containing protein [Acidobacteria bacterium]|nr:cupin domain-containing protein [Acidobacteriota bacterium]
MRRRSWVFGCIVGLVLGWLLGHLGRSRDASVPAHLVPLSEAVFYESPDGKTRMSLWLGPRQGHSNVRLHVGYGVFQPGAQVAEHVHAESHEILFVLRGRGRLTLNGTERVVEAPMAIFIPAGTAHAFTNDGPEALSAVQVYDPAGPEVRFTRWTRRPSETLPWP